MFMLVWAGTQNLILQPITAADDQIDDKKRKTGRFKADYNCKTAAIEQGCEHDSSYLSSQTDRLDAKMNSSYGQHSSQKSKF